MSYVNRRIRSDGVEDVVQETLVNAWQNLDHFLLAGASCYGLYGSFAQGVSGT